jgi:hypothetical protein
MPLSQLAALADGETVAPEIRVAQDQLNQAAWAQFLALSADTGESALGESRA